MMHSSISTTERYIDLPDKELKEKILGLAGKEIDVEYDVNNIVDQIADKVFGEINSLKQK